MTKCHRYKVCIVGLGPAGIGAALTLSQSGLAPHVLCLEAGSAISSRSCSVLDGALCRREDPCEMISGFGGSSLLGGGKIIALPAGTELYNIVGSKDLSERAISKSLGLFGAYLSLKKPRTTARQIEHARQLFGKLLTIV